MGARLCLLGFSGSTLSLIFDSLKALRYSEELIIIENIRASDSIPYDCGLSHRRLWHEDYAWREGDHFSFGVSGPRAKAAVFDFFASRIPRLRNRFVNLLHPGAQVADQHRLAGGIHAEPGCIIAPFAELGFGVTLLRGASVGHHTRLDQYVTVDPGATIAGHAHIGAGTTIGMGSLVFDHVSVGPDCLIGGGSVVNKDIPAGVVAYGNPCRVVRQRSIEGGSAE